MLVARFAMYRWILAGFLACTLAGPANAQDAPVEESPIAPDWEGQRQVAAMVPFDFAADGAEVPWFLAVPNDFQFTEIARSDFPSIQDVPELRWRELVEAALESQGKKADGDRLFAELSALPQAELDLVLAKNQPCERVTCGTLTADDVVAIAIREAQRRDRADAKAQANLTFWVAVAAAIGAVISAGVAAAAFFRKQTPATVDPGFKAEFGRRMDTIEADIAALKNAAKPVDGGTAPATA